ncbi:MAG: hypothetical protein COU32_02910 [Candidatus Magasanikbacteria bacterium CG10_big_fil_rev_8_21_14_0_10_42_10]|uniref:Phosphoesterase HXTX domain-containing protein n=2 Tax=Candidatus Magasanikiibacteriota TaxID=1752731 RepID=A0A2H0TVU7_9BACT|nr:MAG: hypothetical protein COU32_02910 [Candidatus Magasanikbacteria bacterium CG10_big_fil_rev_8_21_14_0_10_42_10]PIZ93177.1 MAG: hypothetical protein COX82_02970 [Candidatus Magasanikbacteria bacterium CG_4_10_14_0_2_um_filter_41_10]
MQKIFHITAQVDLNLYPRWIDIFRETYDKPYPMHISLKTNTYCQEEATTHIKKELKELCKNYTTMHLQFHGIFTKKTDNGWSIMIRAEENTQLLKLQKEISKTFSTYGDHIAKQYAEFELSFIPHITIGRRLSDENFREAQNMIHDDSLATATIQKIVLTIVDNAVFEEWTDPQNKTVFVL